eukprot:GHVU01041179.1.p1 GENE.GHVU01041179.1~~GHVU01041179.1.p1  ORF type:complete len:151 (-),score=19.36 GHVU01041179.1:704-1156(-)
MRHLRWMLPHLPPNALFVLFLFFFVILLFLLRTPVHSQTRSLPSAEPAGPAGSIEKWAAKGKTDDVTVSASVDAAAVEALYAAVAASVEKARKQIIRRHKRNANVSTQTHQRQRRRQQWVPHLLDGAHALATDERKHIHHPCIHRKTLIN